MIEEDYVSFETAKLLKEKGFDEKCYANYSFDGTTKHFNYQTPSDGVPCPTLQMAMKWLITFYNIHITVLLLELGDGDYGYTIENVSTRDYLATSRNNTFTRPEECCEVAIKYCLEKLI